MESENGQDLSKPSNLFKVIKVVVLTILILSGLGIIVGLILPDGTTTKEKCEKRLSDIQAVLKAYYTEHKTYPGGLKELVTSGQLPEVTTIDPWSYNIMYEPKWNPTDRVLDSYVLRSVGPDGEVGTGDDITAEGGQ